MQIATQRLPPSLVLQHQKEYAPQGIPRVALNPLRRFLNSRVTQVNKLVCALRQEGRSFFGRIQTLLERRQWGLILGAALERDSTGQLLPNKRTNARSDGIQELVARYPWASTTDLEIFLSGFDMGERFALHIANTTELVSAPFESLPNQEIKVPMGHISDATPAAIAGVTRNV
jgi:hypothetical protein